MISESATLLYATKREGIIKSNAHFWREYSSEKKKKNISLDLGNYARKIQNSGVNLICAFDRDFPPLLVPCRQSDKPYLFAYRGDISLLNDRVKNFAVVGSLTPTEKILHRENAAVAELTERGYHIVSGLARGCDTAAHMTSLACGGKTIAVLPSALSNIYPKENAELAERIVQNGGLVLTEYITEPSTRYDRIRRFIERDRLQAMFARKILLIASHLPGQGDSGSRHAMEKAKEYGTERFVLYNPMTDDADTLLALNRNYLKDGAVPFTKRAINDQ